MQSTLDNGGTHVPGWERVVSFVRRRRSRHPRVEFDNSAGRDVTEIVFDQTATPEGARTLIQLRMGTVEDEDEDGSEGGGEATIVIEVLSRAPFDVEEVEFGGIADLAGVLRVGAIA